MYHVLYCPNCGKSMHVTPEHAKVTIACPHCRYTFRPAAITPLRDRPLVSTVARGLPQPGPAHPSSWSAQPRSRLAAGLLGIFFGGLGLHRFYLGYHGVGLIQLFLTLASFLTPGPRLCCAPLVAIWGFTEGVFCLLGWMSDAEGRPLGP